MKLSLADARVFLHRLIWASAALLAQSFALWGMSPVIGQSLNALAGIFLLGAGAAFFIQDGS